MTKYDDLVQEKALYQVNEKTERQLIILLTLCLTGVKSSPRLSANWLHSVVRNSPEERLLNVVCFTEDLLSINPAKLALTPYFYVSCHPNSFSRIFTDQ